MMAQRIAYDERDWTKMRKTVTFTGDGVTAGFNLPADYKRMLLNTNVWRSTQTLYPMRFISDTDEWLNRRARNYYDARGEWTMLGGQMLIAPVMGAGITAYFAYLHKNCVALGGGGLGDNFMADGDSFPLDERVLKLGMIWQWKAQKGSPYNEDLGTYGTALSSLSSDKPGTDHCRAPVDIGWRQNFISIPGADAMSPAAAAYASFRRMLVPPQVAQKLETITIPRRPAA
jgi:hypothetical protein